MLKTEVSFVSLGLNKNILRALSDLGYTKPFLVQEKCIPYLLDGDDVLGSAKTGSGKTAAFVLPLLHHVNPALFFPQCLILAPTRELAIQLKVVCINFSRYIHGINVVSVYGGEKYNTQLQALRRGPQVVVGTPGRLLDHLNRKTLSLSRLRSLVIDEADEMLRMGFIEDVRSIILQIPEDRQTVLFSATLTKEVRRLAYNFTNNPKEVYVSDSMDISSDIRQSYWKVSGFHKKEALIRFLEVENFDAAIVFVRTKDATLEISGVLKKYGYNSAALNGDMNQSIREKTLERLRNRQLDILIATDVASRGLDLSRVTLVVNYDAPFDFRSYIHRIGRTGRAGRSGRSLLFIKSSEFHLLRYIEKNKKFKISKVKIPSLEALVKSRLAKFSDKVKQELVGSTNLDKYRVLLSKIKPTDDLDMENLAAVLLKIAQGERSLVLSSEIEASRKIMCDRDIENSRSRFKLSHSNTRRNNFSFVKNRVMRKDAMDIYYIDVGKDDGIKLNHIISAIVNEVNISDRYIGNIKLFSSYSIIELSRCIPSDVLSGFFKMRILNKCVNVKCLKAISMCRKIVHRVDR